MMRVLKPQDFPMTAAACRWQKEAEADLASRLAIDHSKIGPLDIAEQLGHVGHWRAGGSLPDHAVTWSDEVFHIHGLTPAGYVPQIATASDLYDRDAVWTAFASAVRAELPFTVSPSLIRADGELRHGRCYAGAPIVSVATGHPLGALCIVDMVARAETSLSQRALLTDLAGLAAMILEDKVTTSLCA